MKIPESDMLDLRVPSRVLTSPDLTTEEKYVYILIFNFREADGVFCLATDLQKTMLRKSYRNLNKIIDRLVFLGFVEMSLDDKGKKLVSISRV